MAMKTRVAQILENDGGSRTSIAINLGLSAAIIINVAAVMLETLPDLPQFWRGVLTRIDGVSVTIFAIEYLLRLWSITCVPRYAHPVWGRLRYALTPLAIIDLLAILPLFLGLAFDLRAMRALRLLRLARILKLGRYSQALQLLGRVLKRKREPLFASLFVLLILLVSTSSIMFYAENDAQPKAFPSIPATMWWGVATLSTVGYGDVYPVTALGRVIGSLVAVLGIGMFALPAGLLGSGFVEEFGESKRDPNEQRCPHCGK